MRHLVRYVLNQVFPASDELPGVRETDLKGFVQRMHDEASPMMWYGLVGACGLVAATPVLTIGVPLPMFALPRRLRIKHMERGSAHPVYLYRQAFFLMKMCAGMCWGADDTVRTKLGLEPYAPDPGTFRRN